MKKPIKEKLPQTKVQQKGSKKTDVISNQSYTYWLYLTAILLLTAIAFWPVLKNGFTNWDDPTYLENNPLIRELSASNIKRIFTEVYFANYQPLHILSYAIEYHFFQLNPTGYHAVSLIMHLINVILVFIFVTRLSSNSTIALITCLLFAVNPLRVESVAWAAERKDLLYAMFFFASLIYYLNYINPKHLKGEEGSTNYGYLAITFLFFVLSVFSKAMAVSLVPVLFLIDFYVGRKFSLKLILEKIPFFILAVVMGMVSVKASAAEGSIDTNKSFSFIDRVFFASDNLLQYMWKSLVPINLSAFYQYPDKVTIGYYISGLIAMAFAAFAFLSLKKGKDFFFSIAFFVVTVFLVLMLIPVGPTIFSERYSYIPSVALFFFLSSIILKAVQNNQQYKSIAMATVSIYAFVFSYYTYQRCLIWKDSVTLWTNVLQQFPKAPHALNNRGDAYFNLHQLEPALTDFNAALAVNHEYVQALYNRGNVYGQTGKAKEALVDLNDAIRLEPDNANAYNKRGQANGVLGNFDAALRDFNKALQLKPDLTEVYFNLGITYYNANKKDLACENLKKAVDLGFDNAVKPYQEICGGK